LAWIFSVAELVVSQVRQVLPKEHQMVFELQ
jgi:hypothetical protein